jgi:hypothetical protein
MEIDGKGIHHDYFFRLRTHNVGHILRKEFVVFHPGSERMDMTFHA